MDILGNFSDIKGDERPRKVKRKEELNFDYGDTAIQKVAEVEKKRDRVNFVWIKMGMIGAFCILILRIFGLQIVQGELNRNLAEGNSIRPRLIEAPRGQVLDSSGEWLARNTYDFSLAVYPSDLPKKKKDREDYYNKVAALAEMPADEVKTNAEKNGLVSLDMAVIKEDISHEETLLMEEKIRDIPGLFIAKRYKREYNYLSGLGHVLGYTGLIGESEYRNGIGYYLSDSVGRSGIEKTAEQYLRGTHGVEQVEVDSKGNITRVLLKDDSIEPVAGDDVWLYLDKDLQKKAGEAAQNALVSARENTGYKDINTATAIVMDIKTGGILAMVSTPDYDSNAFVGKESSKNYSQILNDATKPMFDRSISGTYPPGSVSKPMLAAGALQEGTIRAGTTFDTPPSIEVNGYIFANFEGKSYGETNIVTAIQNSNNVFFYAVGGGYGPIKGLGIDRINKYWQLFGLGTQTGIDLPGEASGLLPNPAWKKKVRKENWYIGDTYHVSIGQGDFLVTPIQILRMMASFGNDGKLIVPHLIKKVTNSDGNVVAEFGEQVVNSGFISSENLKTVQKGLRQAVTNGSAIGLSHLPIEVAGKTGSAQFGDDRVHGWFAGYAPYNNPEIAVLTMVEGGGMSATTSVPFAKEILEYYFSR